MMQNFNSLDQFVQDIEMGLQN